MPRGPITILRERTTAELLREAQGPAVPISFDRARARGQRNGMASIARARRARRLRTAARVVGDACGILFPILAWCGAVLLAVEW